ncbi:threonylcarbamoyl-AMP synthase [Blastopirellula marina]|uniref:L-threonylcarbamoyladenylate synthase n=1 Tax=Blastopirellula marina TaxID=124 RepID=A0A2S8F775_9BACT|nr:MULTISPECIES: L-threonylcarbamoyladenylate synthase [Pirellulaceae]PQO28005.1 threonylcarbamoyl-AMP synthase [Blastopirellula marina]RCS48430.1 threonylcarbamoyl-AMP synthase [Bremerella cremea]
MPATVIDVKAADDRRDVVHRAVQALAEGQLVAFPTETVYGLAASALNPQAIHNLRHAKGRLETNPFSLCVSGADTLWDYIPNASPLMCRLARRCWPGPVTLVMPCDEGSVVSQFAPEVQQAVSPSGLVGLRVPAHDLIAQAMHFLPGPLALTSANLSGQPDAIHGKEVVEALGDRVGLILDDGKCRYGQPSSVVKVEGNHFQMLRQGVVSESVLNHLSSYFVLFVCTGNTCRSPMAEVVMQKHLADKIGTTIDQLDQKGILVASAGIAAYPGGRAAPEAIHILGARSLDLNGHASQPLSDRLVEQADLILTMTAGHRDAILARWPEARDRIQTLSSDGRDIADPIGGSEDVYRQCLEQIESEIKQRVKDLDLDNLLPS